MDPQQKTWVPEGTQAYADFKWRTAENEWLISFLKRTVMARLPNDATILDVGGRDGQVAYGLQEPKYVHIIDPDPTPRFQTRPARYWQKRVQDVSLDNPYDLIICCHVLGYLGMQGAQKEVVERLIGLLKPNGTLCLFYNTNDGYMRDLLEYSRHVLEVRHFDYLDESLIDPFRRPPYSIKTSDVSFDLRYERWEDLARCCWFLFGAIVPDIDHVAQLFLNKLKKGLAEPAFPVYERAMLITRTEDTIAYPTLR